MPRYLLSEQRFKVASKDMCNVPLPEEESGYSTSFMGIGISSFIANAPKAVVLELIRTGSNY